MSQRWGITFPLDGLPLASHQDVLRQAEALGYTDAWTMEVNGADAFVPLALAAAWTSRMRLGTAIANVFTRTPALLAMAAAAMAEAAPGRFCLGIGSSSPAIVEAWNGVPLRRPLARVRDVLEFLRQAFAGGKVSFTGESFRVDGLRLARPPASPPPVYVAALRHRMLALAGSSADGVIINWLSPEDAARVVAVAREAAAAAGRDPNALDVVCRIFVVPTADEATARRVGKFAIAGYLTTPVYYAFHRWLGRGPSLQPVMEAWTRGDRREAVRLVPDETVDEILVWGDSKRIVDKIQAYVRAGVTTPVLAIVPTTQDPEEQAGQSIAAVRDLAPR